MLSPLRSAGFAVLAALLFLAAPAHATIARFLELQQHCDLSQLIVRAKTLDSRTFVDEKDGRPRTETTFLILETYKGDRSPGSTVALRQMRGPVGEGELRIPGDPAFREGEEVVLFLRTGTDEIAFLTAMGQSKYVVDRSESGAVVRRDLTGLGFLVDESRVVGADEEAPVPLALFGETVRDLAKEGGK